MHVEARKRVHDPNRLTPTAANSEAMIVMVCAVVDRLLRVRCVCLRPVGGDPPQ